MGELTILRMFPDPCGSWLACESGVLGEVLMVYISIAAVTTTIGSALTAGHFGKAPK